MYVLNRSLIIIISPPLLSWERTFCHVLKEMDIDASKKREKEGKEPEW